MANIADTANLYRSQMVNPLQSAVAGYQVGINNRFNNQRAERENRLLSIQEQTLGAKQQEMQQAQEAKRIGIMGYAALNAETPDDWTKLQSMYPEIQAIPYEQKDAFATQSLAYAIGPEATNNILNPTPGTEINNTMGVGETELQKKLGGLQAQRMENISTEAADAFSTIDNLNELEAILDSGFESGFGAETKAAVGRVLLALGVPESALSKLGDIPKAEQFVRAAGELGLKNMKFLKGAMSEKELAFLLKNAPQIGNTREGNMRIISVLKAAAERKGLREDMAEDYLEETGSLKGFERKWRSYLKDNPLFDMAEFKPEQEIIIPEGWSVR